MHERIDWVIALLVTLVNGSLRLKTPIELPWWLSESRRDPDDDDNVDAMLATLYRLAERSKSMRKEAT